MAKIYPKEFPDTRWPVIQGDEFTRLLWDDLRKAIYRRYHGTGRWNWPFSSYNYTYFDYFTIDDYFNNEDEHGVPGDYFSGNHPWRDREMPKRIWDAYIAAEGIPGDVGWAAFVDAWHANYPNNEGDLTPYLRKPNVPTYEKWIYVELQDISNDAVDIWRSTPVWVPAWVFLPIQTKRFDQTSNRELSANDRRMELNWWKHREGWDTHKYVRMVPPDNELYAYVGGNKYHTNPEEPIYHVSPIWQSELHQMRSAIECLAIRVGWVDYCQNSWRGFAPAWDEFGEYTESQHWKSLEGWKPVGELVRRRWPYKAYSDGTLYETIPSIVTVWDEETETLVDKNPLAGMDWFLWLAEATKSVLIDTWLDRYEIDDGVFKSYIRPKFKEYPENEWREMEYRVINDFRIVLELMKYVEAEPWSVVSYVYQAIDYNQPTHHAYNHGMMARTHMLANYTAANPESYTVLFVPGLYLWKWASGSTTTTPTLGSYEGYNDDPYDAGDGGSVGGYCGKFQLGTEPTDESDGKDPTLLSSDIVSQGAAIKKHLRIKCSCQSGGDAESAAQAQLIYLTKIPGASFPTLAGWGGCAWITEEQRFTWSNGILDITNGVSWDSYVMVVGNLRSTPPNYQDEFSLFTAAWQSGAWECDFKRIEILDED
jgi:hypothetical protein